MRGILQWCPWAVPLPAFGTFTVPRNPFHGDLRHVPAEAGYSSVILSSVDPGEEMSAEDHHAAHTIVTP